MVNTSTPRIDRQLRSGVVARRRVARVRVDARRRPPASTRRASTAAAVRPLAHADRRRRTPEAMTFLSNSEINPQFMREGRIMMSTEKVERQASTRSPAGALTGTSPTTTRCSAQRRDLAVHPERRRPMDTYPSIGYSQATDIREGADGNYDHHPLDEHERHLGAPGGRRARDLQPQRRTVRDDRTRSGFLQSVRSSATRPRPATRRRQTIVTSRPRSTATARRSHARRPDHGVVRVDTVQSLAWDLVVVDPTTSVQTLLNIPSTAARSATRCSRTSGRRARRSRTAASSCSAARRVGYLARDALHAGCADGVHGCSPATCGAAVRSTRSARPRSSSCTAKAFARRAPARARVRPTASIRAAACSVKPRCSRTAR